MNKPVIYFQDIKPIKEQTEQDIKDEKLEKRMQKQIKYLRKKLK